MIFSFRDFGTNSYPHVDYTEPPNNVHYEWCKKNIDKDKWRVNFYYPYYEITLNSEDATLFKLIFGYE